MQALSCGHNDQFGEVVLVERDHVLDGDPLDAQTQALHGEMVGPPEQANGPFVTSAAGAFAKHDEIVLISDLIVKA